MTVLENATIAALHNHTLPLFSTNKHNHTRTLHVVQVSMNRLAHDR